MTDLAITPRPYGRLMVHRAHIDTVVDRGQTWMTDGAVFARAEVFTTPPKPRAADPKWSARQVRGLLEDHRQRPASPCVDTGVRTVAPSDESPRTALVIDELGRVSGFDENVWPAWAETGMSVDLDDTGTARWWANVRGHRALYGLILPRRLGAGVGSLLQTYLGGPQQ